MPPAAREGRGRRSVDDTLAYAGVAMLVLAKVPSCFDGNISRGSLLGRLAEASFVRCAVVWFRRDSTQMIVRRVARKLRPRGVDGADGRGVGGG